MRITKRDIGLLWDLIHLNHIGKISDKETDFRFKNLVDYYTPNKIPKDSFNVNAFRKEIAVLNGGAKDKEVKIVKKNGSLLQIQETKPKTSKSSKEPQITLSLTDLKGLLNQQTADMMQGVFDMKTEIESNLRDEIQHHADVNKHNFQKQDMKIESIKNLVVTDSSFWDISWADSATWLKSQFRKNIVSSITAIPKLGWRGIKTSVYYVTVGPSLYVVPKLAGGASKLLLVFIFGAQVMGGINFAFNTQSYPLPSSEMQINNNRMCISQSYLDQFSNPLLEKDFLSNINNILYETNELDDVKLCLPEQFGSMTQFEYYSNKIPVKPLYRATKHYGQIGFNKGWDLSVGQYELAFKETIPKNFPMAKYYADESYKFVDFYIYQTVGSLYRGIMGVAKATVSFSTNLNPMNWFGSGGKRKCKRKGKRKVKKMRKHSGINQSTGRLKKGYKYSGKKLKSGLPQIVKI